MDILKGYLKDSWLWIVIVIGLLLITRWYGNHQWAKGEAQGRQYVSDKLIKEKEKEWAEREKEIAAARADIADKIKTLNRATARMITERAEMKMSFDADLERLRNEREKDYATAASVPDDRVWLDIRTASGELARNPRQRGTADAK